MDDQAVQIKVASKPNEGETHESFLQRVKDDLEKAGHVVLEIALTPLAIAEMKED